MALSYPRAQTLIIAIICVAAVSGALYYSRSDSNSSSSGASLQADAAPVTAVDPATLAGSDITISSDWKKEFSSTTAAFATASKRATSTENLTVTDQVGRDFFLTYIQLKQANLVNSTDTVSQTMGNILDNRLDTLKPKVYAASDIVLAGKANSQGLAQYAKILARVIETYNPPQDEAVIVTNYLNDNDPIDLKPLDSIIETYKAIIGSLTEMSVPEQMIEYHLAILNAFSQLESAATDLRLLDADAIRGMAGTTKHADGGTALIGALQSTQNALNQYGVAFAIDKGVLNKLIQ